MEAHLRLLGCSELRRGEAVVDATTLPTTKALDLLRLVAGHDGPARRADDYVAMLWPAVDDARGRSSLRTALSQIRRVLGSEVVLRAGDRLVLGPVRTDVARLRQGAQAVERLRVAGDDQGLVRLAHAVEELCGDQLAVSDGSCEAVLELRDELAQVRRDLLLEAAGAAVRCDRPREALALATRADRLGGGEAAARVAMTAWAALGEVQRVVETFEHVQASLGSLYGVQPSQATRDLYLEIVTGGEEVRTPAVDHHRPAAAAAARAVATVLGQDPPGGVVWLHGEPGSGRDSVARDAVRRVLEEAPHLAGAVLRAPEVVRLDDHDRDLVLRTAVDRGIAVLVPVRRPPPPGSAREVSVEVDVLRAAQLEQLLERLLGGPPSSGLQAWLERTTGGLAGVVCRTVDELLRSGFLEGGASRGLAQVTPGVVNGP